MRLMKNTQGHDEGGVIKPGAKLSGNAVAARPATGRVLRSVSSSAAASRRGRRRESTWSRANE